MVILTLTDKAYAELLVAVEEHLEAAQCYWKHSDPGDLPEAAEALARAQLLDTEVNR